MSTYDLKGFQQSASYQLDEAKGTIVLGKDWKLFSAQSRQVCDHFLTLAAASLLADMKPALFFMNLCRCAENWRRFMVSAQEHFQQRPSLIFNTPVYAAIIAQDTSVLTGICEALPKQWQEGEEYPDQFHLTWLPALLQLNGCQVDDNVETHLQVLEEAEPERCELYKALLGLEELEEADFWNQFNSVLYAHEEDIEKRINSVSTDTPRFIAHRFIWFEGLALLRLALIKGFVLPSHSIMFCPDEALMALTDKYQGDWPLVPLPVH